MRCARTIIGLGLLFTTACGPGGGFGTATVEGAVGPQTLPVTETVFAIHDDEMFLTFGGVADRQDRKPAWVRVHLFEAAFDPTRDLRWVATPERLDTLQRIELGAYARISFRDGTTVTPGATFEGRPGPFGNNDVQVVWRFSQSEVMPEQAYPHDIPPTAFNELWKVTLDEVELADEGRISGTLELDYVLGDSDPVDTHTGTITVAFDAPMVPERLAECNEDSGWGADDGREPDGYACGVP